MSEKDPQINFERATDPAAYELDAADYDGITFAMLRVAEPKNLQDGLIGVKYRHGSSLKYDVNLNKNMRIGMLPDEYVMIHRAFNPEHARRYAENLTRASRGRILAEDGSEERRPLTQEDIDASERAGIHIIKAKKQRMERYLAGTLLPEVARIEALEEYAGHPFLRRKKESGMRKDVSWARDIVMGSMIDVLEIGREWTQEQAEAAEKTITWRLFFDREDNRHHQYWSNILDLGERWWTHRGRVFDDRIERTVEYLDEQE